MLSRTLLQRRLQTRCLHVDSRDRLSCFWTPTESLNKDDIKIENRHNYLVKGGFIRQTHAGIFHLLPLGLRVQQKIEALLDKHMRSIGAAKLSMSSITSQELWKRSQRLPEDFDKNPNEFFTVDGRRMSDFLLAPTHEEEITTLVTGLAKSYRDLPLRLYQVSRKYRNELRPRKGLLRAKEFVMKDLYTFDATAEAAMETYSEVRAAYDAFFTELGLPFASAQASSGDMGGKLSHEYHFTSPLGEDVVLSCGCGYSANQEIGPTDACPDCGSPLRSTHAIEVGHTFYLGTRYSEPLEAQVSAPNGLPVLMHMGCYGIGVSRLIAAIAVMTADNKGLRWPRSIAPFSAVIIPFDGVTPEGVHKAYDDVQTVCDAVIDDRDKPFAWKLKDADLIGYPFIIVLGRRWMAAGEYEVQCRWDISLSRYRTSLAEAVSTMIRQLH
ncbi:class II aaRS and biotin synthetase [Trichodelitschia bisporula]|uniref:proline--tRNA ligase n=1 Tax=Trichodelitschia bisporula TaxID=703511 RepID=A0A6G1HYI0_9PEZI|nr:class II aaRS and biotin synthetase [Trichodelitschia bisporula]